MTLSVNGEAVELPRTGLDGYWRGRATVFWQMPPGYARPSRRGDDDVTSAWLAERFALLDGAEEPAGAPGRFDAALEDRVRVFQLRAGLRPDGIVGPRTWMRLNDETGVGTPTLGAP
jgi:general secretion pathway protein A